MHVQNIVKTAHHSVSTSGSQYAICLYALCSIHGHMCMWGFFMAGLSRNGIKLGLAFPVTYGTKFDLKQLESLGYGYPYVKCA